MPVGRGPGRPFQKGHKLAKGGLRDPPGGRPTKEETAKKLSFLAELERLRDEWANELATTYYEMAKADPATMRHAVDKVMPNAKQTVVLEHEGLEEIMRKAKERKGQGR